MSAEALIGRRFVINGGAEVLVVDGPIEDKIEVPGTEPFTLQLMRCAYVDRKNVGHECQLAPSYLEKATEVPA